MNLAQCIAPEWAQGLPRDGFAFRPGELRVLRVITHTVDGFTKVDDAGTRAAARQVELERKILVAQVERRPAAVRSPLATLPRGVESRVESGSEARARRRGGVRRSESNPWPRGKKGLRYQLLKLIGSSRKPRVALGDLTGRVGSVTQQQIHCTLAILTTDKHVERSGSAKFYRYAITEAGRKALEWGA